MSAAFQRATKRAVRARIALDGPSGSGKTWTMLEWARVLGEKVAVVDTERGSASLYADRFEFDVSEIGPPFHPDRLVEAIRAAEKAGYDVLGIDSLSHFWEGEGGVLDIADAAGSRSGGNSWAGWKSATPILRHLVDVILASDLHVIVTMRSKTEWVLEEKTNREGRRTQTPTRVGMAPVMRAGMEYEFTVVGDLDLEHRLTVSKSRCDSLADLVVQPGRAAEAAEMFRNWMRSGVEIASRPAVESLKATFAEIEPADVRAACKREFAGIFGNPDYLVASKMNEARAWVAARIGSSPAPPPPAPAEAAPSKVTTLPTAAAEPVEQTAKKGYVEPKTGRIRVSKEKDPAPDSPATVPVEVARGIHINAKKHGIEETMLRDLIGGITDERTRSTKEVTEAEAGQINLALFKIGTGKSRPSYDENGKLLW